MRPGALVFVAVAACEPPPEEMAAGCVIAGLAPGEEVLVHHAGPSEVGVLLGPATQISVDVGARTATVRGPHISFLANPGPVVFHAAAPIAVMGGLVRLDPGVPLVGIRPSGDGLTATATPPDAPAVDGIALACAAVLPGRPAEPASAPVADLDDDEPAMVKPRSPRLVLHSAPGSPESVTLVDSDREEAGDGARGVQLRVLSGDGAWTRLAWGEPGLAITGWAETAAVRPVEREGGMGGHILSIGCCIGANRWDAVQRRAILRAGTELHTAPQVDPWASVHTAVEVIVEQVPGAPWAQLVDLPDVIQPCRLTAAWVRSEDIP